MYKLLSKKSYLLFMLLCCSFFSCERILELIKPTDPTKPVASCRIKMEDGREFFYDQEDKLVRIYGPEYSIDTLSQFFVYNDKDQVIRWYTNGADIPSRNYDYDSLGRLKHSRSYGEGGFYTTYTYNYKIDTVVINYRTDLIEDEQDTIGSSTHQTTLCFKQGNLVRVYRRANPPSSVDFDSSSAYTNTPNKISDTKKKLAFLLQDFTNPLMSKNLPLARKNMLTEDPSNQTDRNYNWILNEKGYPLNNGLDNKLIYEYECIK